MTQETITQENLTRSMKWELAERLRAERLDAVNEQCKPVSFHETVYTKYIKRLFDILISGLALLVTLPINLVVGLITWLDVGRPIFFLQERVGRGEKPFRMVKFRNMTNDTDANGELLPPDQRVTRWGKLVRKTSVDELLNFWSIFKGDMSVIGPRPLAAQALPRFHDRHRARFYVRPGLECPPHDKSAAVRTWEGQFENDVWYVEHLSFKTDVKMVFNLIRFTFDRKNAALRAAANRGSFLGYSEDGKAISEYDLPQEYYDWLNEKHGTAAVAL